MYDFYMITIEEEESTFYLFIDKKLQTHPNPFINDHFISIILIDWLNK